MPENNINLDLNNQIVDAAVETAVETVETPTVITDWQVALALTASAVVGGALTALVIKIVNKKKSEPVEAKERKPLFGGFFGRKKSEVEPEGVEEVSNEE